MKASELMNGDLVRYGVNSDLCKFIIDSSGAHLERISDNNQFLPCCEVNPIPLTEDILKANGLKVGLETFADKEIFIRIGWYNDYINPLLWKVHIVSYETDIVKHCVLDIRIHYVHELQHALRLCGLNDLADNFKLAGEMLYRNDNTEEGLRLSEEILRINGIRLVGVTEKPTTHRTFYHVEMIWTDPKDGSEHPIVYVSFRKFEEQTVDSFIKLLRQKHLCKLANNFKIEEE